MARLKATSGEQGRFLFLSLSHSSVSKENKECYKRDLCTMFPHPKAEGRKKWSPHWRTRAFCIILPGEYCMGKNGHVSIGQSAECFEQKDFHGNGRARRLQTSSCRAVAACVPLRLRLRARAPPSCHVYASGTYRTAGGWGEGEASSTTSKRLICHCRIRKIKRRRPHDDSGKL